MAIKSKAQYEMDWVKECNYISERVQAFKKHGLSAFSSFNCDKACFIRYCEMQRNSAEKNGIFDSAEYIQQCIDDLD